VTVGELIRLLEQHDDYLQVMVAYEATAQPAGSVIEDWRVTSPHGRQRVVYIVEAPPF
jgi:hypothetical protein